MLLNLKSRLRPKADVLKTAGDFPNTDKQTALEDAPLYREIAPKEQSMLTRGEKPDCGIEPPGETEFASVILLTTDKRVLDQRAAEGTSLGKATKAASIVGALLQPEGASMDQLMTLTGWQAHSVRGFLSSTARKKLGFVVIHIGGSDGIKRYRITGGRQAA